MVRRKPYRHSDFWPGDTGKILQWPMVLVIARANPIKSIADSSGENLKMPIVGRIAGWVLGALLIAAMMRMKPIEKTTSFYSGGDSWGRLESETCRNSRQ